MTTITETKLPTDLPPSYPSHELEAPLSSRSSSSLPAYDEPAPVQPELLNPTYNVATPFTPTQKFRIDAEGQGAIRLPLPPKPDPIPVYDVTAPDADSPLYVSLRNARNSGTCQLVRGDEAVCTTTYRFGPGKPPIITLHSASRNKEDASDEDEVVIENVGAFTRSQVLRSRHGTLRWRYASSKERKAQDQDSVLILEKIAAVSSSPNSSRTKELATEVGRFVRGEGTRTPGTSKASAGNGGLLLVDLSEWQGEKKGGEEEEVRVLVVASCIAMLKKEVDRRRAVQTAVAVSVLTGGGG